MEFDFQKWAKLARENGAEFERQRRAAIEAVIAGAPPAHQQRLRGLQFRIDMERSRSATALGACVRINSLMWASFARLREELNSLADPRDTRPEKPRAPGQVVPFGRRSGEPEPSAD
jgi:hypothetical protein